MIKVTLSNKKAKHTTQDFLYDFQKNVNRAFPSYKIDCEFADIEYPYTIDAYNLNVQMDISVFIENNTELFFA